MSKFGRAILFTGSRHPLEEKKYPLPERLAPGSVLVQTKMTTVCGSDVHTRIGRRPFPTPSVLGHEIVGTIVRLGEGVCRDTMGAPVDVGDRITFSLTVGCRTCRECVMRGLPQKCASLYKYGHVRSDRPPYFTGGFAEYVVLVPGTCFYKIPEKVEDAEAAPLMCAGATVYAGVDSVGVKHGDIVLLQGVGMLGFYAAALTKSLGARSVIAVDRNEKRLSLSRRFGVDETVQTADEGQSSTLELVMDLTGGSGVDLVIEATGDPAVIPAGIKSLGNGGRYLLFGALYPGSRCTVDSHELIVKCLTVRGVHNYDPKYLGLVLQFMAQEGGKFPFKDLVGPQRPLTVEGVEAALTSLEQGQSVRPAIVP